MTEGLRLATYDEHLDMASCLAIHAGRNGATAEDVAAALCDRFKGPVFHLSKIEALAAELVRDSKVSAARRRELEGRIKAICAEIEGWVPATCTSGPRPTVTRSSCRSACLSHIPAYRRDLLRSSPRRFLS